MPGLPIPASEEPDRPCRTTPPRSRSQPPVHRPCPMVTALPAQGVIEDTEEGRGVNASDDTLEVEVQDENLDGEAGCELGRASAHASKGGQSARRTWSQAEDDKLKEVRPAPERGCLTRARCASSPGDPSQAAGRARTPPKMRPRDRCADAQRGDASCTRATPEEGVSPTRPSPRT